MGMGIDDLLCKEYRPAKRTNLLNDESQMIPLMDLENSEAVVNFDGSYFKFETALDSVANDLALVKKPIRTAHAEAVHVELKATRRVTKNAYHHLGLFDHSVEALVQCEQGMIELPDWVQARMREPLAQGVSRLAATKLASLLHDIGKPDTWIINDDGKHTFIGHDKLGAEMCEPLAKRMKWAKPVERLIEKLVRWHLRPGHLFQQGVPTDKAKYRFYRTIGEELPELILLALADFRSTCGPGLQVGRREAEQNLFELLSNYSVYEVVNKKEDRLLDGNELMRILDLSPGPVVGQLLEDLLEAQILGEIKDREQAAELARKLFIERYQK